MGLALLPTAQGEPQIPKPTAKCCGYGLGEPHVLGEQRLAGFVELVNAAYRLVTVGRSRFEPSSVINSQEVLPQALKILLNIISKEERSFVADPEEFPLRRSLPKSSGLVRI